MRNTIYKKTISSLFCIALLVFSAQKTSGTSIKLENQFKQLRKEIKQLKKEKKLDEIGILDKEIRKLYTKIYNNESIKIKDKFVMGLVTVETYTAVGRKTKALELCEKIEKLPSLSLSDKIRVKCVAAGILGTEAAYENVAATPGATKADKLYVYRKMAYRYRYQDRNPDKLKQVIKKMLALNPQSASRSLHLLAKLRLPGTSYTNPENVEFAYENLLRQGKITGTAKARAFSELIEAKLRLKKIKEAEKTATKAQKDTTISKQMRFQAALVLLGLKTIKRNTTIAPEAIDKLKKELKPNKLDQYDALNGAAASLREFSEGRVARQLTEIAKKMIEKPKNTYLCRYMEKAPLGASGWLNSKLIDNLNFRESRFRNYKQKDAEALITDVNAMRSTSTKAKNKEYYFKNTAFYMAYDENGWHIFVLCKEPKIKQMLLDGVNPGALEMYFAPGADRAYYQWIISQKNGKLSIYDWASPNRFFRPANDYMKTETVVFGDTIGTYIFFPWEMVYDKLPFSTGKEWIFEMIRWSPAGGISWSGGKVHNTGKWGHIKWEAPTKRQLSQIKRNLLRKAWSKYKQTRKKLVDLYWAKRDFGDPDFLRTMLIPEVKRQNNLGESIKSIEAMSYAEVDKLYEKAMSDWMEFEYKVANLRRQFLTEKFTTFNTGTEK